MIGATEEFAERQFRQGGDSAASSRAPRSNTGGASSCSGFTAYEALFQRRRRIDPIGKRVRIGGAEYPVVGVLGKRPSPGGFDVGADNFIVIPQTTHQVMFNTRASGRSRGGQSAQIAIVPYEQSPRATGDA